MSNFKLNLPTDIPWIRKCVSDDMTDDKLCDIKSPFRWHSSIVVFEYKPEDEFQNYEGMTISYLKVVCTITGYQEDQKEIGLNYRGLRSYWKNQPGIDNYLNDLKKYYPCMGAVLEVTVGPEDSGTAIGNFPYFMDFEPKKRELFEAATEAKEKMSRSIESLNLTKSAGTTQSLEAIDIDAGGGAFGVKAEYAGMGAAFNYSAANGQWGTKRMNAEESMSSRSSDVGQEKRETFSHTTQISQLYHQLDSYHLGTNRALFFINSRPHTIDPPFTFVNGPRNIEGIQEFMLVVARPKDVENICVEAYLETGHIAKIRDQVPEEIPNTQITTTWSDSYHASPKGDDDETTVVDDKDKIWEVKDHNPGYIIKNAVIRLSPPDVHLTETPAPNLILDIPHIAEQNKDLIRVSGSVRSWFEDVTWGEDNIGAVNYPFTVDITLVKIQQVEKTRDTLFITGRKLCCCPQMIYKKIKEGIVYEKILDDDRVSVSKDQDRHSSNTMSIVAANRRGQEIKEGIINSRTDIENRYTTPVNLPQTNFANKVLLGVIKESHDLLLRDLKNIPENIQCKLSILNNEVKLKDILSMPFEMQKDLFSMNDDEVIELRNAISGVNSTDFDPKAAWLSKRQIQKMFKRNDYETE